MMIRALLLTVLVSPAMAHGIDRGPSVYDRGEIRDFFRPRPRCAAIDTLAVEQRIWNGDVWLPLGSYEGADFFRQIEQEIKDGTIDAE